MMRSSSRGFTLVELVVSVGLFAIVMLVAAGAYLVMINLNRQSQAYASGINNLAFALELMAREVKGGSGIHCVDAGNPTPCSTLGFTTAAGEAVTYSQSAIVAGSNAYIRRAGTATNPMTDTSLVNITSLAFYITGVAAGDQLQPHVTILVGGTVTIGPGKLMPFHIETGSTLRGPDIAT